VLVTVASPRIPRRLQTPVHDFWLYLHHYGPEGNGANHHTDTGDAAGGQHDGRGEPDDLDTWTAFHESAGSLPQEQRDVFNLLWYDGLTQPEAASVLGISLATVKRRWQEARISLSEAMRGE
jgi:DNA-directed RNA polymerase specialized sigma24 family protein